MPQTPRKLSGSRFLKAIQLRDVECLASCAYYICIGLRCSYKYVAINATSFVIYGRPLCLARVTFRGCIYLLFHVANWSIPRVVQNHYLLVLVCPHSSNFTSLK